MDLDGLPLFNLLPAEKEGPQAAEATPVLEAVNKARRASQKAALKYPNSKSPESDVRPEVQVQNQVQDQGEIPTESPVVSEPKHYTVSELTNLVRGVLEPAFVNVWVQGEVSNYRPAASGHIYFSLKDSGASISAAVFGWGKGGGKGKIKFDLKDGLEVLCRGKISVYPPRGSYQMIIDHIEPLGAGALQVAFEQLKARLAAEGLFSTERKRALPPFPNRIAIVTSPSGAAIRDMLIVLARRAPHVQVVIIPAVVQGENAPGEIIRGIELANRHHLGDVVVLARGGGSIEDLWCFNDESLARSIAASRLPVISAVGHEIDFTISDFVADLRAPTPSAAAEIVTGYWSDVTLRVRELGDRLAYFMSRDLANRTTLLAHIAARVVNPRDKLREQSQKCDELFLRLERAMRVRLDRRRSALEQCMGKLDALSPLRVLERGYAIVLNPDSAPKGKVVRSAVEIKTGQELEIRFYDGQRMVEVK